MNLVVEGRDSSIVTFDIGVRHMIEGQIFVYIQNDDWSINKLP